MSFGRNPYVAKAEAAEQKAEGAGDAASRARAYREAAHEWERAAAKEKAGKQRDAYLAKAEQNRGLADEPTKTEHTSDSLDVEPTQLN